jgi:hypothetical protein
MPNGSYFAYKKLQLNFCFSKYCANMIKNYLYQKNQSQKRLDLKVLDSVFLRNIEQGANCSPYEAKAILDIVKKVYSLEETHTDDAVKPGQMKIIAVSAQEPAGKPLDKCHMLPCIVTVYNGNDDDITRRHQGVTGLRRKIILRITAEALEQGVLLTQEDLAFHILHCGLRTLSRDLKYFKEHDIFVPTRGLYSDIGSSISHKVKAVELLLQRKNEHEIAKLLYHNIKSIERYTFTFSRIVYLAKHGFDAENIAFTLHISSRLASQYLDLYDKYNNEQYQDILDNIIIIHNANNQDLLLPDKQLDITKKNTQIIKLSRKIKV